MNFAKKSLGQNFLIEKNIIKKILNLTNLKRRNIVEIGPGRGELTNEILKFKPKSLTLIENIFSKYLKNVLPNFRNKGILYFSFLLNLFP